MVLLDKISDTNTINRNREFPGPYGFCVSSECYEMAGFIENEEFNSLHYGYEVN